MADSLPSIAVLNALALVASALPNLNPPTPIYAIIGSDDFIPLTIPSSWGEFSYKYSTQVSDYPVEKGAFAAYNKAHRPSQVYVQMIKTGSDLARFAWLTAIQQTEAANPTRLYTIVSPQAVNIDYTLTDISYETRQDRGSNILRLELQFTEVPQIPSSAGTYTNVAEAQATPVSQLGRVFTSVVSTAQATVANARSYITG